MNTNEQITKQKKKGTIRLIIIVVIIAILAVLLYLFFSKGSTSIEEAKEIALQQVPGATLENVVVVSEDEELFSKEYTVQILHNGTMYDIDINGRNGNVLDLEAKATSPSPTQNETAPNTTQNGGATQPNFAISVDKAKEIAVKQVPGSSISDIKKIELDTDNPQVPDYDVEIHYSGMEYDFEINANTGDIVSRSQEKLGF